MPTDPLQTLRRFYATESAYLAGDRDFGPIAATLHADCAIHQPASLPYGGVWRGHAGFEAWKRAFAEQWAELPVTGSELVTAGDVVVSRSHVHAVHKPTGRRLDWPLLQYFKVRDGLILDLWPFHWDTAALVPQMRP